MVDRRHFLGSVLGLSLGGRTASADEGTTADVETSDAPPADDPAYRTYLDDLARCDRRVLGTPRRLSLVAQALYPVAPERLLVVREDDLRRFGRGHSWLRRQFRRKEARWASRWPRWEPLPSCKVDVCVGLMDWLTAHYRRPDLLARWGPTLLMRETLGSTGIGRGMGLLHDFQDHEAEIETTNGGVDWWLVLFPDGLDWQALDDEPVYYMVAGVLRRRRPGDYLRLMEAIPRSLRWLLFSPAFDPAAWARRLAALSSADAARQFNYAAARGLADRPRAGRENAL